MKINKKLFDLLTREPDEVQQVSSGTLEIFFMTELEESQYSAEGRYSIWSSDGQNYRLLMNKDFYEHGVIKEFYTQPVNDEWTSYVEKVTKLQRKFLFTIMLPAMAIYLIVSVLALILWQEFAIYILIGMMLLIFLANFLQNKAIRTKVDAENEITQDNIQQILGSSVYDQIAQDQLQFREIKNLQFQQEYEEKYGKAEDSDSSQPELIEETIEETPLEGEDVNEE